MKGKWTKGTRWANALKDFNSVYLNPFSSASTCAKITDGECTYSCGLRLQTALPLTNNTSAPILLLLFPGIHGCLAFFSVQETDGGAPLFKQYTEFDDQEITSWRYVSAGVRFMLTNNSDTNEGFFEAVRVPIQNGSKNTNTKIAPVENDTQIKQWAPDLLKLFQQNLVENPTYICGRLRDIQKYEFQIKPQKGDHVFKNRESIQDGADPNDITYTNTDTLDDNFDAVFIKITGRPSTTGSTDQSQIMVHSCSNLEICYDQRASLARFHTPGARDLSGLGRVQNILQSNMKAARRVVY